MKGVIALLLVLLVALQVRLWFGDGGILAVRHLAATVEARRAENQVQAQRNQALEAEVRDLKEGTEAVEERARRELGMVGKDEVFYQILPNPASSP